jgi:predicted Zn finger-like uncharacterized protein
MGFLDMRAEIGDLDGGFARASDSLLMILTCPECATGYFVDDAQIKSSGRAVRCAACGHRWTALPEKPMELTPLAGEAALAALDIASADTTEASLTGDDLPKAFRDRAEEARRLRRAAITGVVWAGAAVVVLALVGAAIVFREQVVRAWPKTASAYAAIGLPVNPLGLVIEQVRAEPSLQDGHATLAVSGVIRNVEDRAVIAPPLRISLTNAQGKRVAGQIADLANARIPAGETRHFLTAIFDPPFSAQDLQVEFAPGAVADAGPGHAIPGAPPAAKLDLRGPTAPDAAAAANTIDAQPLPPDQLDAAPANNTAQP